MSGGRLAPVKEYLPKGEARGRVLVVSDHRPLNLGHAAVLCAHGYAVYTAVTCTDVRRIFETYQPGDVDLIVFASLVHGWHHMEGERRPGGIPETTDAEWQTRNMRAIIDLVSQRQERVPEVVIATELIDYGWYSITAEALESAGIRYHTYSAKDPRAILALLG